MCGIILLGNYIYKSALDVYFLDDIAGKLIGHSLFSLGNGIFVDVKGLYRNVVKNMTYWSL